MWYDSEFKGSVSELVKCFGSAVGLPRPRIHNCVSTKPFYFCHQYASNVFITRYHIPTSHQCTTFAIFQSQLNSPSTSTGKSWCISIHPGFLKSSQVLLRPKSEGLNMHSNLPHSAITENVGFGKERLVTYWKRSTYNSRKFKRAQVRRP
ncbi:hypothetical protein BDZ94DRAFT_997866 [Collybia nuda]|uniref:Uncharacterized protein n=1 Tax=Collybia nuda TaxID=64659 RepID=A0A9P5XZQ2_9AGAR|nr:hypothetical protein BDZ94DRAFT_997866 [Collybia nuda]